jgi:hypothetical protein
MADKYIAIADDGRGTRTWTVVVDGAWRARRQAMDELKPNERLTTIALITWECEDERPDDKGRWPMSNQWGE